MRAVVKSGQIVACTILKERGHWFWKRYLVCYRTRRLASPAHTTLSGVTYPAESEYKTNDTEWVSVVTEDTA